MSKTLLSRFDKKLIAQLPRAVFQGRVIVIQNEQQAEKAVRYLLSQPILGFDTETRPNFKKGGMNQVALLQVSSHDTCFLFRLNHIGLPQCLLDLLADTTVQKIGLSWHDDVCMLRRRDEHVDGQAFVELQTYAKEFGIMDMSLQKLYANVFGEKISKSQQLSNWEADVLSEAQKQYAATDAWACIRLYEELHRLKDTGDYTLEVVPEPEPQAPSESSENSESSEKKKKEAARKKRRPSKKHHRKSKKKNVQEPVS